MTALSIVSIAASSSARWTWAVGLATRTASDARTSRDRAKAVHHERRAGRDEIDDRLGEAEPRRDLDRAGDRDDVDGDARARRRTVGWRSGGRSRRAGRRDRRRSGTGCRRARRRRGGTGRSPSDRSRGSSAPVSARRSSPVTPRSATPSPTNSMTSFVRTNRMSRSKLRTRATRLRSCSSKTRPASRRSSTVGSTRRPLFGTASRSRSRPSRALIARPGGVGDPGLARRGEAAERLAVAALAVVEPRGDPRDGGGARAGLAGDRGVVLALVEPADDRPALGQVAELAERAEVAEEAGRLVGGLEAKERVDQLVDVARSPVVPSCLRPRVRRRCLAY